MELRLLVITTFFLFSICHCQTSLKQINLDNGKYGVGFKHYQAVDSTRTYSQIYDWNKKYISRPIPVSLWYPAAGKSIDSQVMKVLDYMAILKEEEEWEFLPNEQILNWFYYPNTKANQNHLKEQTMAYPEIEPAKGKFPVIVYAPSYQASSIENFALCEYLASHGYVVISSPSRGAENRFLEGGTAKDMETQARDIEFLIKKVQKLPNAEQNQIATMGFSFGGLSNVIAQMRNDIIKAIISLDGSIKYQYSTLRKSPFFNISKVDVPFIHMAQKDIPQLVLKEDNIIPELNTEFEFYDSITNSRAYQLKFHNLTHPYFSTLGVLFQPRDKRQDKSDIEIMESYKLVSIYTLNFLNAFLKSDMDALRFMENNSSENVLVSQKSKKPKGQKFSFQDFNELAAQRDYQDLEDLYQSILINNPSLELPEGNLNNLGLQLLFNPRTSAKGIKVLSFATTVYPDSANLFDSLAEAYLFVGNAGKAVENFKKSLELNSQNRNAIDRLEQLGE